MRKTTAILCALCIVISMFGCGVNNNEWEKSGTDSSVTVMLSHSEGIDVLSNECVDVLLNGTAVFHISVKDGYEIKSVLSGAKLVDDYIILENVKYPTTIYVETVKSIEPESSDEPQTEEPTETGSSLPTEMPTETPLPTASPTPIPTETPKTEAYKIKQKAPQKLNNLSKADSGSHDGYKVIYDPNGGTALGFGSEKVQEIFSDEFYYCPNALVDAGYFSKSGFVLKGYNTSPDGTGKYYAPGWNILMNGAKEITLYCSWEKEAPASDFEYIVYDDCVRIVKYKGESADIVIPEKIEGKKVAVITKNAFENRKISSVFIPKYVESVEDGAFNNCGNIERFYINDNIISMTDGAFLGTTLKTLNILAVRNPTFANHYRATTSIKYERLLTVTGPKIIHLSGSNGMYGLISEQLANEVPGYSVINMSIQVDIPMTFYLELVSTFTNENDLVVMSPELNGNQWGLTTISNMTWFVFECAYDALSRVNIGNYKSVFTSFAVFNKSRMQMEEMNYEYHNYQVNRLGDLIIEFGGPDAGYSAKIKNYKTNGGVISFIKSGETLFRSFGGTLNKMVDMVQNTGAKCLLSITAMNRTAMVDSSKIAGEADQKQFEETLDRDFHGTRISALDDYLFEDKYFYNEEMHLNHEGRKVRTSRLAKDIKAYLERNK